MTRKYNTKYRRGRFRSIFERRVADYFKEQGYKWKYEPLKFVYYQEQKWKMICANCGAKSPVLKKRTYTPDFILPNGTVIEVKGRLTSEERSKLLSIQEYHPDMDLKLVMENDRQTGLKKYPMNSDWLEAHGFDYCFVGRGIPKEMPAEWFEGAGCLNPFPVAWETVLFPYHHGEFGIDPEPFKPPVPEGTQGDEDED